jgi:hypothetical protein
MAKTAHKSAHSSSSSSSNHKAAAKPPKTFTIINGKDFITAADGVVLDKTLQEQVDKLLQFLIDNHLVTANIKRNEAVRSPKRAHKWSTAWNIRHRNVPLANLQALTDGKDEDGNLWYDPEWEKDLPTGKDHKLNKEGREKLWVKIIANAKKHWNGALAAEGYALSDSRSKPNVHKKQSNHVFGNAMDISIPWKSGATFQIPGDASKKTYTIIDGKQGDNAANRLIAHFKLSRPVKNEAWHFQLSTTAMANKDTVVTPDPPSTKYPYQYA